MSGSGGGRSDYEPTVPIGSPGSVGKGSGGGGGSGDDPCAIVQDAPINSPNPAIVPGLAIGTILDVTLTGTAPHKVLQVNLPGGVSVGSLTHRGHLALIRCIEDGNTYQAEVIQRTGGAVVVRIERV